MCDERVYVMRGCVMKGCVGDERCYMRVCYERGSEISGCDERMCHEG